MRDTLKQAIQYAPKAVRPEGCLKLVIFDCDGVLVDSERFSAMVLGEEARKHGWNISDQEFEKKFAGVQLKDIEKEFSKYITKSLPEDWITTTHDKIVDIMKDHVEPMPNVKEVLQSIKEIKVPFRVGSNSSHSEMEAKFSKVGLKPWLSRDRIHSGMEVERPKPFPDLYLYAAKQEGVNPEDCMVVEDSNTGLKAAYDAGMACVLLRDLKKESPDYPGLLRVESLNEVLSLVKEIIKSQK